MIHSRWWHWSGAVLYVTLLLTLSWRLFDDLRPEDPLLAPTRGMVVLDAVVLVAFASFVITRLATWAPLYPKRPNQRL